MKNHQQKIRIICILMLAVNPVLIATAGFSISLYSVIRYLDPPNFAYLFHPGFIGLILVIIIFLALPFLVATIFSVTAGILGLCFHKKSKGATICLVMGIISLMCNIGYYIFIHMIFSSYFPSMASPIYISVIAVLISIPIPLCYIIFAYQFRISSMASHKYNLDGYHENSH